jgi:hypothetical protein
VFRSAISVFLVSLPYAAASQELYCWGTSRCIGPRPAQVFSVQADSNAIVPFDQNAAATLAIPKDNQLLDKLTELQGSVEWLDPRSGDYRELLGAYGRYPGDDQLPIWPPSAQPSVPPFPLPKPKFSPEWQLPNIDSMILTPDGIKFVPELPNKSNAFPMQFWGSLSKASVCRNADKSPIECSDSSARLVNASQLLETEPGKPSDYWRAKHDTVRISFGIGVGAADLGVPPQVPLSSCTGFLLSDRMTVLTAAHCLEVWGDAFADGATGEDDPLISLGGEATDCDGEDLTFALTPATMGYITDENLLDSLVGTCSYVIVLPDDLAVFRLKEPLGEEPDWLPSLTSSVRLRAPTDLEYLFNYPIYVPQFPHLAAQYEDWGEVRPLTGCTVTFAMIFKDDDSIPLNRAISNYGCISVDTYSGSSGAPVFIRTVDVSGIHYDLCPPSAPTEQFGLIA